MITGFMTKLPDPKTSGEMWIQFQIWMQTLLLGISTVEHIKTPDPNPPALLFYT